VIFTIGCIFNDTFVTSHQPSANALHAGDPPHVA
jgi:hypothetical protein